MSWHDPDRNEPEADSILRAELRGLLGMPAEPRNYFESEPSPELIRLADDLRREALRRNHTARRRNSWMLAAAALPFALAATSLGYWGLAEKREKDQLAAAVARQETEIQHLAAAQQQAGSQSQTAQSQQLRVQNPGKEQPSRVLLLGSAAPKAVRSRTKEPMQLVITVPNPVSRNPNAAGTENVKAQ